MKIAKSTLQNKEKSHKNALTYCIIQTKVYFTINKPTTHKKKLLPRPIVVQHFTLNDMCSAVRLVLGSTAAPTLHGLTHRPAFSFIVPTWLALQCANF